MDFGVFVDQGLQDFTTVTVKIVCRYSTKFLELSALKASYKMVDSLCTWQHNGLCTVFSIRYCRPA